IEQNMSTEKIIEQGYCADTVHRVADLVDRSEYKRRQAAPGLRVTTRAFGLGRRMPIARGYDYR
ncbi:MAG TPA: NAD+ synthase, partial [Bacillota bacterium]|nr:NAD+ synthase [Bacillota bacterium]